MRPVKRKIWSSLSVILAKARLLYAESYLCTQIAISAQRYLNVRRDRYLYLCTETAKCAQ